jgi:filamentous hemagglutinin family protein
MGRARRWLPTLAGLALAQSVAPATAEIATDGTAGPRLELNGPNYAIGADLGTRAGRNLFHSFERFSLRTGERATFTGPDQIRRVISRVTGGERSDIDGTLRSMIPGADFYFLNPAGVVFGPNASLDLQGSFHVSTADELRFADGKVFGTANPAASYFTVAPPEAFGFLGTDPASITVNQGVLAVPVGEALSIVGGDIDAARAGIGAAAGRITLSAVGGPGEARLGDGEVVADRRADITLRGGSRLLTRGDGGGMIRVRGGAIVVEEGTIADAGNTGPRDSQGGIEIDGDSLEIHGGAQLTANVLAVPTASGRGGSVSVRADEVQIAGGDSFLTANTAARGDAGTVTVVARDLEIRGGARIGSSSSAEGRAGTVSVDVGQLRVFGDGSDELTGIRSDADRGSTETGDAGTVRVTARDIEIRGGGEIRSSTFGAGNAGTVEVLATDRLLISGTGAPIGMKTGFPALTGISSSVEEGSTGAGGTVAVTAENLELRADGKVRSVTFSQGRAGTVTVMADRATLLGGGQISSSTLSQGTGESGNVILTVHGPLSISGQSRFQTSNGVFPPSGAFASTESRSPDARAGGTVTVTAPVIRLADRGKIASEVFAGGAGGAVDLRFTDLLEVDGAEISTKANNVDAGDVSIQGRGVIDVRNNGQISSTVFEQDSAGNAGDIDIVTGLLIVDSGRVQANGVRGRGGNIAIGAEGLIRAPNGVIEALSALGVSGTVVTSTPEADLAGGLVVLDTALLDAASQLRERCAARRDVGASSFTGVGRGGLPPSPDDALAGAWLARDGSGAATVEPAGFEAPDLARPPSKAWAGAAIAPCVAWPAWAAGWP